MINAQEIFIYSRAYELMEEKYPSTCFDSDAYLHQMAECVELARKEWEEP